MSRHYQLNRQEHMAVSEAARAGGQFDRPEMLCRTGDGHAQGTRTWADVTCRRCLEMRPCPMCGATLLSAKAACRARNPLTCREPGVPL